MQGIIKSSLQFRFLVVVIAGVLVYFGIAQLGKMPVDVLPEFSPPYVEIQTEALGLSADEVEQLINVPLEHDLLNGVAWLDKIRSEAVPGLSSVTLIFEPGTDLYRARQMVAERLSQAAVGLPHVSKSPTMLQPRSSTSRVMIVGLSSKNLSLIQLSVLARWTIAPRLMGVPGVANVAIWGLRDRQLQVQVDPERLRAHDVSLLQVLETTGNALWVSTLSFVEASTPGNAGFIDTPQQRLGIRHNLPIISPEGLSQVPVELAPKVRLIDVAKVVENHQPLIGDAMTADGTGLLLVIEKFPGSNTLEVTRGVEDALTALRPGLPGIAIDPTIFRPATFIEMALNNLMLALIIGSLLVALIIFAFYLNWRTALITMVVIPLSLVTGAVVLYLRGATFNMMVLAGFVIALAVVIDDAIIDVENVDRRLRQYRSPSSLKTNAAIILEALAEMRNTMVFPTLILILAVLPIFFLEGMSGAFFQPLALSYVLAVLASMFVAMTVTPVLCTILLSNAAIERRVSPLPGWLQRGYDWVLARFIHHPRLAYLAMGVTLVLGLAVLPFLRQSLLPTFKEPELLIHLDAAPGTSQPEMVRMVTQASRELQSIPGVRNLGAHVGRAIFGDQVVNVNSAEIWVDVELTADYDKTVAAIQQVLDSYPGLQRDLRTYLKERSSAIVAGPEDSLVVRISGQNLEVLRKVAEVLQQDIAGINGIVDSRVKLPVEEPILEVEVDLTQAQRYGIKPGEVRRTAAILLNGLQVGSLFEEQKVFDVVVWSTPETRSSLTSIGDLLIDTPNGGRVRLGDVAQMRIKSVPNVIKREDVSRYLDIGLTVSGRDADAVAREVQSRLKQIQFPLEYHAEVLGDYAKQQAAQNRLLSYAVASLIGIFFLLQATFQSWRLAMFYFLTLPLALVGGLLAAFVAGGNVSLGSLAALLMVFGIAARSGITQIKHYQNLEHYERESFGPGLVLRGSRERVSPILMTALATGLALAPVLLLGDVPGLEILRPMAIVILGGLVTSTLFNLFILPALYLRFALRVAHDLEFAAVPGVTEGTTPETIAEAPGIGGGN